MFMRRPLTLIALALAATQLAAQPVSAPHVTVELVPERAAIAPGQPFRIGLRFDLEKEWHTYWRNPGDVGLAPTLELTLPPGFTASEIAWPYPDMFGDPPEVSYGFHDTLLLPITITPPSTLEEGTSVVIGARASWLVCYEQCIPGKAALSLSMPVSVLSHDTLTTWAPEFTAAEARLPRTPRNMEMTALRVGNRYELVVANAEGRTASLPADVWFFASEENVIDHSAKQTVERTANALVIGVPVSASEEKPPTHLRGVLYSKEGWNDGALKAITVEAPVAIELPTPVE